MATASARSRCGGIWWIGRLTCTSSLQGPTPWSTAMWVITNLTPPVTTLSTRTWRSRRKCATPPGRCCRPRWRNAADAWSNLEGIWKTRVRSKWRTATRYDPMPALDARVKTALDETRLLILGAQILFGFHLNGAFQNAFDELGFLPRALHA